MAGKNTFVLSLGGSLVVPKTGIDWKYLKRFRQFVLRRLKEGKRLYIVVGGGATCRDYNYAANKVVAIKPVDLDWLGIHASRLNAHLLRTIFYDIAHPEVIKNPTIHMPTRKKVVLAGAWKPGWSTDYVAAIIAQEYGIKTIINLSNIDYAYDKDPRRYRGARRIERIDWKNFRRIVGSKWTPGLNAPFDPIASRKAENLGLRVVIANGRKLINLKKCLNGESFRGTVIG